MTRKPLNPPCDPQFESWMTSSATARSRIIRNRAVRRDRGFTLIELLVVISIVWVLISLMSPDRGSTGKAVTQRTHRSSGQVLAASLRPVGGSYLNAA